MNIQSLIETLTTIKEQHGDVELIQFHEDICYFNEQTGEWQSIID
jgi:hypothetical protein